MSVIHVQIPVYKYVNSNRLYIDVDIDPALGVLDNSADEDGCVTAVAATHLRVAIPMPSEAPVSPTQLTERQKLLALSMRYYSGLKWAPKAGDYYTTCRDDLELYRIIDVTDTEVVTIYCNPAMQAAPAKWPKGEFLSPETFGAFRVYVHPCVLGL